MIAVILPSRGIADVRVFQAIDRELSAIPHIRIYRHEESMPECFNGPIREGLQISAITAFWFIEEDTIPPFGALQELFFLNADIAAINYHLKFPSRPLSCCTAQADGKILWVSLGTTLIQRTVFEKLSDPWFEVDKDVISFYEGSSQLNPIERIVPRKQLGYGGHDMVFCFKAMEAGFSIRAHSVLLSNHSDLRNLIQNQITFHQKEEKQHERTTYYLGSV